MKITLSLTGCLVLLGCATAALGAAPLTSLRVCADPGNMPFSNNRGEGYEQKIAQVIAEALGTNVAYYYRPGIERGLTRQTLNSDNCDLMLDLPGDAEGVLSTAPLYRSTFVFATRADRNLDFKTLDDPRLKTLKIGVYQTSAIREALAEGERMLVPALVLYEWRRGPRLSAELAAQEALFPAKTAVPFGPEEAAVNPSKLYSGPFCPLTVP